MALEIIGTPYVLSIEGAIDATNIVVGYPSDWYVLPVYSGKRIYIPFDGCLVLFMSVCSLG